MFSSNLVLPFWFTEQKNHFLWSFHRTEMVNNSHSLQYGASIYRHCSLGHRLTVTLLFILLVMAIVCEIFTLYRRDEILAFLSKHLKVGFFKVCSDIVTVIDNRRPRVDNETLQWQVEKENTAFKIFDFVLLTKLADKSN